MQDPAQAQFLHTEKISKYTELIQKFAKKTKKRTELFIDSAEKTEIMQDPAQAQFFHTEKSGKCTELIRKLTEKTNNRTEIFNIPTEKPLISAESSPSLANRNQKNK